MLDHVGSDRCQSRRYHEETEGEDESTDSREPKEEPAPAPGARDSHRRRCLFCLLQLAERGVEGSRRDARFGGSGTQAGDGRPRCARRVQLASAFQQPFRDLSGKDFSVVLDATAIGQKTSLLFRLVRDNFTSRDLGRIWKQCGHVLPHPIRSPLIGFVSAGLILKDARRNHHATTGIHPVVGDEPRELADERHEAFADPLPRLTRIDHSLVPPHRCIHIEHLRDVGLTPNSDKHVVA